MRFPDFPHLFAFHIKLTVKTFLHNLHVKQPEKTATETETQRQR